MCFYSKIYKENINTATVLYSRRVGAYGHENVILMENFKKWLKENKLFDDNTVILAIPLDNPNIIKAEQCRYDVCMIYSGSNKISSENVKMRKITGGKYVIFLIEHTNEAIKKAWQECFFELEKLGYLLDISKPTIERYVKKLVDKHYCELCIPIL